jgi:hypothetical protein
MLYCISNIVVAGVGTFLFQLGCIDLIEKHEFQKELDVLRQTLGMLGMFDNVLDLGYQCVF